MQEITLWQDWVQLCRLFAFGAWWWTAIGLALDILGFLIITRLALRLAFLERFESRHDIHVKSIATADDPISKTKQLLGIEAAELDDNATNLLGAYTNLAVSFGEPFNRQVFTFCLATSLVVCGFLLQIIGALPCPIDQLPTL